MTEAALAESAAETQTAETDREWCERFEAETVEAVRRMQGDEAADRLAAKFRQMWDDDATPPTSAATRHDNDVLKSIDESLKAIARQTAPVRQKSLSEMSAAEYCEAMDRHQREGTQLPPAGESAERNLAVHPEVLERRQREAETRAYCDARDREEAQRDERRQRQREQQESELRSLARRFGLSIDALSELPRGSLNLTAEQLAKLPAEQYAELMNAQDAARRR